MTSQQKAYLYGLGAVLAWSTVATAFKVSLQYLSPSQLVLYASLSSFLSLFTIVAIQGKIPALCALFKTAWQKSLLLGLINPFLYYLVLFGAYARLPAQEAQAINYTWALTMTLLSVPFLKHKLHFPDIVAALLCYAGVLVIGTRGEVFALQFSNTEGVLFALASTLLWASYWIFNAKDQRDSVLGLTLNFMMALPIILAWCYWQGELTPVAWQGLAGAAYIGAIEMGVTFVMWLTAMRLTQSTAKIANLIFLSPIISLWLIHWFVGEPIYPSTLLGLGFILGGLVFQKIRGK